MENDLKKWLIGLMQSRGANPLCTQGLFASFGMGIFHIDGKSFDVHITLRSIMAELYADIDEIEDIISFNQKSWDKSALTALVSNIITSLKKGNRYRLSRNHIVQI